MGVVSIVGSIFFLNGKETAPTAAPSAAPSPLVVDPSSLAFGTVWESEQFDWAILIRNISPFPVEVTRILTSCHCTTVSDAAFEIPSGGTHRVPLKLDLTRGSGDSAERSFAVNIMVYVSDERSRPFIWTLKGRVRDSYDFQPSSVNLGDVLVTPEMPTEQRFVIRPGVPLADLEVTQDGSLVNVSVNADSPKPDEFTILVRMTAAPELGPSQARLSVVGRTRDGERLPVAFVPVRFRGVGDVGIRPELPDFGGIPVGATKRESYALYSRTKRPFRVRALRVIDSPSLEYALSADDPLTEHSLVVRITGLHAGRQSGHIEIDWLRESSSDADSRSLSSGTLHIPVTYVGIQAVGVDRATAVDSADNKSALEVGTPSERDADQVAPR
jgi:hypothetical protein